MDGVGGEIFFAIVQRQFLECFHDTPLDICSYVCSLNRIPIPYTLLRVYGYFNGS